MEFKPRYSLLFLLHTVGLIAACGAVWAVWQPWQRVRMVEGNLSEDGRYRLDFKLGRGASITPRTFNNGRVEEHVPNEIAVYDFDQKKELWRIRWGYAGSRHDACARFENQRWVVCSFSDSDSFYSNLFALSTGESPLGSSYAVKNLDFTPDDKWFVVSYADAKRPKEVWDAVTGTRRFILNIPSEQLTDFEAAEFDVTYVWFTSETCRIESHNNNWEFSLSDGRFLKRYHKSDPIVQRDSSSPDKKLYLAESTDFVHVFDRATRTEKFRVPGSHSGANGIFSPDSSLLATIDRDRNKGKTQLWSTTDGTSRGSFAGNRNYGDQFSPDGRWLVTVESRGYIDSSLAHPIPEDTYVNLWNVKTGALERSLHFGGVISAVYPIFLPENSFRILIRDHCECKIFDLSSGELIQSWAAGSSLSPDRRTAVLHGYGTGYGNLAGEPYISKPVLIDTASGAELFSFESETNAPLLQATFLTESKIVLSGSRDGSEIREIWTKVRDERIVGLLLCPQVWVAIVLLLTWPIHLVRMLRNRHRVSVAPHSIAR